MEPAIAVREGGLMESAKTTLCAKRNSQVTFSLVTIKARKATIRAKRAMMFETVHMSGSSLLKRTVTVGVTVGQVRVGQVRVGQGVQDDPMISSRR